MTPRHDNTPGGTHSSEIGASIPLGACHNRARLIYAAGCLHTSLRSTPCVPANNSPPVHSVRSWRNVPVKRGCKMIDNRR